jgi:uncharacterized protein YegL
MGLMEEAAPVAARVLPVILLVDTSGSLEADAKIEALNQGLQELVTTLAEEDDGVGQLHVGVITFGGDEAQHAVPLQPVGRISLGRLEAAGRTRLGGAFRLAGELLEDRELLPTGSYRPILVLLSDGLPTDDWEQPLADLLASERGSKAARMALGIGADADRQILAKFAEDVRRIDQAHQIVEYLQFVTMTVIDRGGSTSGSGAGGGTVRRPNIPEWIDDRY